MGLLSEAPDGEDEFLVQLVQVPAHQVAHLDILQVMPPALIPGVQVGGIARQGLQPHPAARPRHELLDLHPPMDRRAVPDHQQPLACHAEQVQEELDRVQPVERLLPDQGVDATRRRHPPHDREVVTRLLLAEDRGEPLRGVGLDHPRQEVEARFVLENQDAALAAGTPEQFRPGLVAPAADGPLVALGWPA